MKRAYCEGGIGAPGGVGAVGRGGTGIPGAPGELVAEDISESFAPHLLQTDSDGSPSSPHAGHVLSIDKAAGLKHMDSPTIETALFLL